MRTLETIRCKLDEMAILLSMNSSYLQEIEKNPVQVLTDFGILEENDSVPLYAWSPIPSSITAW